MLNKEQYINTMDKITQILTIAIPTYNRADYLDRCLHSIFIQLVPETSICVKIFDNCSTDTTEEVVKKFTDSDIRILYTKNEKNIGPDLNIGQCYYTSTSKYTLVFGDDDVFLEGALAYLMKVLDREEEFGLVFLNYYSFKKDFITEKPKTKIFNSSYLLDRNFIMKIVGYRIGFISANIVNNSAINKDEIINNVGTYFNHLFPILGSVKKSYPNVYIGKYLIAQQIGNSENFDFFKVFADNFYKIIVQSFGYKDKIVQIIETECIIKIVPFAIVLAKKKGHKLSTFDSISLIQKNFSQNILFWICDYPLLKLPFPVANFLKMVLRFIVKIYYFFIQIGLLFKKTIKG
jgi:abequosyltransferase